MVAGCPAAGEGDKELWVVALDSICVEAAGMTKLVVDVSEMMSEKINYRERDRHTL